MADTVEPISHQENPPVLRLSSMIDAAKIKRLRTGLSAVFYEMLKPGEPGPEHDAKLAAIQARYAESMAHRAWILPLFPWIALGGLAISLAFAWNGGIYWDGHRLDIAFALFFLVCLALVSTLRWLQAWKPTSPLGLLKPWYWMARLLAWGIAWRTLRAVSKLAPFEARYDFTDGAVAYTRITKDGASLIWQQPLEGWRRAGPGFTLIFKDHTSLQSIVIMHEPNADLDALLERQGVHEALDLEG